MSFKIIWENRLGCELMTRISEGQNEEDIAAKLIEMIKTSGNCVCGGDTIRVVDIDTD